MSDTDESAVIVDSSEVQSPAQKPDDSLTTLPTTSSSSPTNPPELVDEENTNSPSAFQIVSIGNEQDAYAFHYHQDKFESILQKIPPHSPVAIVSVVGAFRTGKSFLLSWFLRYLHYLETIADNNTTTTNDSSEEDDPDKPWYQQFQTLGRNDGFEWKGGSVRNTTGIWMWSEPHLIPRGSTKPPLAVLLVDTQGMFDHETTMALTASIFGLSTLLSSYQIYNVDKRIQEDNLQQLALFSEYARLAVESDTEKKEVEGENEKEDNDDNDDTNNKTTKKKPFQHIEFLVRDWQHFEDDVEDEDGEEMDYDAIEHSMQTYLDGVISEREAKDLQETREQILSCFEKITCFGLCHPGFAVTKMKYTGDVSAIESMFLKLLDRYCQKVFDPIELEPKVIHGRELTAAELGTYIQAYAQLFASGASFPTAATLLEATTSANNTNAINLALKEYKETMDRVAGPRCSNYIRPDELKLEHKRARQVSMEKFHSIANFGSKRSIQQALQHIVQEMDTNYDVYDSLNQGRNPLAGMEIYLIPSTLAVVAWFLRWVTDLTCSPYSQICKAGSELFSHLYAVVFCFLAIVALTKAKQIKDVLHRMKTAIEVLSDKSSSNESSNKSKRD